MRFSALIAVLTLLQPNVVLALGKPSNADFDSIEAMITRIEGIDSDIVTDRRNIDKAKSADDRTLLQADLELKEHERLDAYNRAIWLTMIAYDIFPGSSYSLASGVEVSRSIKQGQHVEWLPYFSDHKPVIMIGPEGRAISPDATLMTNTAAITASDGTSRIYPEAFISPGVLAATLLHEKTHFDIDTTHGRGDVLNRPEGEVAAYQAEQDAINAGIIKIPPEFEKQYKEFVKGQIAAYAKKAKEEHLRTAHPPTVVVRNAEDLRLSDLTPHTDEELKAIRRNAVALRKQVDLEREDRLAQESFQRQIAERKAQLDFQRQIDEHNSDEAGRRAMMEAQLNVALMRASAATERMNRDAAQMRLIVMKLCNGEFPLPTQGENPELRQAASNFASFREDFIQTGERADVSAPLPAFRKDWIYINLKGCERNTMKDLYEKNPPLSVWANAADEAWLSDESLRVRPKVDAPMAGGRPPTDEEKPSRRRDSDDSGSRVPSSVRGHAWGQLNSWPHD